jgi:hypothetical protein
MDDPTLDVDAILDEFFSRYYGAAADPMRRLYLRIEEIFSNSENYPAEVREIDQHWHQDEDLAWGTLGTEERLAELGEIMEKARQAARTELEKKRVALFDEAVWQYIVEGRRRWVEKQ